MKRYAYIREIKKGVVFSDPSYDESVWCQYRKEFSEKNWLMQYEEKKDDGIVHFQLSLGRAFLNQRLVVDESVDGVSIRFPSYFEAKSTELGMDTACIFCGSMENWENFAEEAAIHTGTDGCFGDLITFSVKGEQNPSGFLLLGAIDEMFAENDSLFQQFVAGFDAIEIAKERFEGLSVSHSIEDRINKARENYPEPSAKEENKQNGKER